MARAWPTPPLVPARARARKRTEEAVKGRSGAWFPAARHIVVVELVARRGWLFRRRTARRERALDG